MQVGRHPLRRLVEAAEGVGQARVRVAAHGKRGHRGQLLEERPHLRRAQRAIDPHREEREVGDGVPERLGGLAGQIAAGAVGDGQAGHHRQAAFPLVEERLDGEQRRLGIQGVEDRLHQQQVDAALGQAPGLFQVGGDQLVEGDAARPRVVDVPRERGRLVAGSERARHEDRAPRMVGHEAVGGPPRAGGGGGVHLLREALQAVVGLGDRRGGEAVGLDDVGAGLEIKPMDLLDHLGPRDGQQVAVALQVLRMVREARPPEVLLGQALGLQHGAHGAVEDDDALGQERAQGPFTRGSHGTTSVSGGGRPPASSPFPSQAVERQG